MSEIELSKIELKDIDLKKWLMINQIIAEAGEHIDISDYCFNFLKIIGRLIPFCNAHFIFYDRENGIVPRSYRHNINQTVHDSFLKYYKDIDDFYRQSFNNPEPIKSTAMIDYRQWRKTECFNDFYKKNKFYYICITDIHYRGKLISSLSLIRDEKSPDFSREELLYLELLTPHIASQMYKTIVINDLKEINSREITDIIGKNEEKFAFSDRESNVVELAIKGYNNCRIADELFLSKATVKKHLQKIYRKCGVHNRTELLAKLLNII